MGIFSRLSRWLGGGDPPVVISTPDFPALGIEPAQFKLTIGSAIDNSLREIVAKGLEAG